MNNTVKLNDKLFLRNYKSSSYKLNNRAHKTFLTDDIGYEGFNDGYLPVGLVQFDTGNNGISLNGFDLKHLNSPSECITVGNTCGSNITSNTICTISILFAPGNIVDDGFDLVNTETPIFKWERYTADYSFIEKGKTISIWNATPEENIPYFSPTLIPPNGYELFSVIEMNSGHKDVHITKCIDFDSLEDSDATDVMTLLNNTSANISGTFRASLTLCYIKKEYKMKNPYYRVTIHGRIPGGTNPYLIAYPVNMEKSNFVPGEIVTGSFVSYTTARQAVTGNVVNVVLHDWEIINVETQDVIASCESSIQYQPPTITSFQFVMPRSPVTIYAYYEILPAT